ncbi:MAG: ABC transporter permease [Candidatus Sericytochromatia bacterium]
MSILSIAKNTFKEAIRDKILYIIILFSIFMIASSVLLSNLSIGQNQKMIVDIGLATINLFGVLITLFVGTSLLNKEIEKKTIYLLLTKPLRRSDFILGKHLGLSYTLFIITSIMSLCFYGILFFQNMTLNLSYLQVIALGYVELLLLMAFAIFFSTFASPVMSAMYTLGIYLTGHFTQDILNIGKLSQNETFMQVTQYIYYILPDLEKLNLKNIAIYMTDNSINEVFAPGLMYGATYTIFVLIAAIFVFEFKEF